jgi:hypothetical protein
MISLILPKFIRSFDELGIYILGLGPQLFAREFLNNKKRRTISLIKIRVNLHRRTASYGFKNYIISQK